MNKLKWIVLAIAAPALLALLIGCGGGGGGSTYAGSGDSGGSGGVISGTAIKGPVAGATVTAYMINADGTVGGRMVSAMTDSQGNFSMAVGNYSGPVMLRMTGGYYKDEATGADMPMAAGDVMTAVITHMEAGTAMSGVHITPLTSMAQAMSVNMPGGMTPANITGANSATGKYYGINDIVFTRPIDPTASGSGYGADRDAINYGMFMAAMSEYAATISMPYSSGMVTAMMNDASDGIMNGTAWGAGIAMNGGTMMTSYTGTAGMADAMAGFINSAFNMSGITFGDMTALMDKMRLSDGTIQNGMTHIPGGMMNSPYGGFTNSPMTNTPMTNSPMYGGGPGGMM